MGEPVASRYPAVIPRLAPLLTPPWIAKLPPAVTRAIAAAAAPGPLRALMEQAPRDVTVDLRLPADPAGLAPGAAALLKLLAQSPRWLPGLIELRPGDLWVGAAAGERRSALQVGAEPLEELVEALFCDLFPAPELLRLAHRFAAAVARQGALQVLTQHMLAAPDVDAAVFILLSGLTAGDGLGMNRAALFTWDEIRRRFVGKRAIGPADAAEAHRIWESLEIEGRTLEHILASPARSRQDSRLQGLVYGLELAPGDDDDDEVALALRARAPCLFDGPPRHPALARLGADGPYLLAVLQPRDRPLGLVFADNLFSRAPIGPDLLAASAMFLSQSALVWDNVALLRSVERLARYDGLTGVLNRREFEARMAIEEMRCLRSQHPCALLILDLDRFKEVNDNRGHAAGDAVLRQVGDLLRQTLRAPDLIGRFGGDEFIVLLVETPAGDIETVVRRIGRLAWEHGIPLSVGAAAFPADCEVPAALFALADQNLYAAKNAGRGRACLGRDRRMLPLAGPE